MKKNIILILLISCYTVLRADTTHVLFVGNSITYFNNMPQTFQNISNSLGDTVVIDQHTPGGTGFVNHVTNNSLYNLVRQGNWDYVVLQPGSNESPGYSYPINETLDRAEILNDSIYKYNPCAKILYYEISYGVWGNTPGDLQTYNNTMDSIRKNLTILADSTQAFFAPVGEAFKTAWNNDQSNMLWGGTGDIHPNVKGSYIAACVFYSSIFQKPSFGTTILNGFTLAEAEGYQTLADTTVLNHLSDWRINTYTQRSTYTYIVNLDTIYFSNTTQNFDSLLWDFGDGFSSSTITPSHIYLNSNSYTVNLTTYLHGCSITTSKTIYVGALGINENGDKLEVTLYPNPTNNYLNIKINNNKDYLFKVYNSFGKLILTTNKHKINISQYPSGTYFLEVNNNKYKKFKWIKY